MGKAIKLLVVEDSEDDTQLAMLTLRRAGFEPRYRRVQDADALLAAIGEERWDAVLSDSRLPAVCKSGSSAAARTRSKTSF